MRLVDKDSIQIGDFSKTLGITSRTVRLYEEAGILPPPQRTAGGIRYYKEENIKSFKIVLKLKALGLSLEEMAGIVMMCDDDINIPEKVMPHLIKLLDKHLKKIKYKISMLNSLGDDITRFRRIIVDHKCQSSAD